MADLRRIGDGHLSPLDLEAIERNLIDRLRSIYKDILALRDLSVAPGVNTLTHRMLYNDILPESAKAYSEMNSLDVIRQVSDHDKKLIAGMPAIEGASGGSDIYFEVGAIDDNETLDETAGAYGMRAGQAQDMEVVVRYHGESEDPITLTHVDNAATEEVILASNGDTWKKIGGAPFGFTTYPSAQSFQLAISTNLEAVVIYVKCTDDTIPVTFRVELYAADEVSGYPSLAPKDLKQSGEYVASTVSLTGEWITIKLDAPFPRLGAGRDYFIVVWATPSDLAKSVYWYYSEVGDYYVDGFFAWYNRDIERWEFVYEASDAYLKLYILSDTSTTLVTPSSYAGWQEVSADVSLMLAHDLWEKSNLADFYLTVPEGVAVNAIMLRDKASKGEAHWRCDHVRTRHIVPFDKYTFTPGYYTSTSWDGDAKNGADGIIDLSAEFGLPAGIRAVVVQLQVRDETAGVYASLKKEAGQAISNVQVQTNVANYYSSSGGVVECDSNGDIYFGQSDEVDKVIIVISGYWS